MAGHGTRQRGEKHVGVAAQPRRASALQLGGTGRLIVKHLMGYKAGLTVVFLLDRNASYCMGQIVTGVTFKKEFILF